MKRGRRVITPKQRIQRKRRMRIIETGEVMLDEPVLPPPSPLLSPIQKRLRELQTNIYQGMAKDHMERVRKLKLLNGVTDDG